MNIALKLRKLRMARNISQEDLGMIVGVHRGHIARLESGERTPRLDTLENLAAALKVKITSLLSDLEKPVPRLTEEQRILSLLKSLRKGEKKTALLLIRGMLRQRRKRNGAGDRT